MTKLSDFVAAAKRDEHVWISDVRRAFAEDASAYEIYMVLDRLDGSQIEYACPVPRRNTDDEFTFLADYLSAEIYNIFSVYSGRALTIYGDESLHMLFETAFSRFYYDAGYKKVLKIAKRLSGAAPVMSHCPLRKRVPLRTGGEESGRADISGRISAAVGKVNSGAYCGIDVGGTDIKLAASLGGRLIAVKEYDWNPALLRRAESIKAPILLLARLMAACVANERAGGEVDMSPALAKNADNAAIERAIREVEKKLGKIKKLDAVGLSFPDIVIDNRIMGGETPKTAGIRADKTVDYEAELAALSRLNDDLLTVANSVSAVNDGPMATFSAMCELAYSGADTGAVFAHSLGTDLGSGWIDAAGNIRQIPLECYDLLFDLGSYKSRYLPAQDIRSLRNENSGMAGARRYLGQAAVYRLVWLKEPSLIRKFVDESRGFPEIRTQPEDMRKPCFAYIMEQAAGHNKAAEDAFTQVGVNLARITEETEHLTRAGIDSRWLFGRFVKNRHCFELMSSGFASVLPNVKLIAADDDMASTPLMKQLAARDDAAVAQFAQAISAIYYSEYKFEYK